MAPGFYNHNIGPITYGKKWTEIIFVDIIIS